LIEAGLIIVTYHPRGSSGAPVNECTSSCRCCVVMSGEVRVGYRQGRSVTLETKRNCVAKFGEQVVRRGSRGADGGWLSLGGLRAVGR
jgi:hypothetical protein